MARWFLSCALCLFRVAPLCSFCSELPARWQIRPQPRSPFCSWPVHGRLDGWDGIRIRRLAEDGGRNRPTLQLCLKRWDQVGELDKLERLEHVGSRYAFVLFRR